ncbi:MAG: hypothetical protein QM831_38290 [Kofleriaceae bacterium]
MSLLTQILAAPDDDHARLVWADKEGGERGELVAIQCAMAAGNVTAELRGREADLLALHGAGWSNLAGYAKRCTFHRGFVDAVLVEEFTGNTLRELWKRAPLATTLEIEHMTPSSIDAFFANRAWRNLQAFGFATDQEDWDLGARLAREDLSHLRGLGIETSSPIERFPLLPALERLHVRGAYNFPTWYAHMPKLRALQCDEIVAGASLPAQLVELEIADYEMPNVPRLVRLRTREWSRSFEMFDHLISVDLAEADFDVRDRFVEAKLPSVRELRWIHEDDDLPNLVMALGQQLDYLAVSPHEIMRTQPYVSGLVDTYDQYRRDLLSPRVSLVEPWFHEKVLL